AKLRHEGAFEVLDRAAALAAQGRDIINLGIGQPDFPTPDNVVQAGAEAILAGHHGYTPANGILPLREAVADDIRTRRKCNVSPENILIMPGGKPTMFFACLMFGEPGAEIMYPNPGFPIYESAIKFSGAIPVPITLHEESGFSFSARSIIEQITTATRLIIINSPANPTGGVVPREQIEELVEGLEKHPHVTLLSDEIYSRIQYDGKPHISLLEFDSIRDRLIMLDGWSKTYAMTGWRLGYSVWPSSIIEKANRLSINDHSCVNHATQWAGIEALKGPQIAVDKMVVAFDERRKAIVEELNSLPGFRCAMPGGHSTPFPISPAPVSRRAKCRTDCWRSAG
ncbi:MAG: aminotransferase class I/II-fold pyridoxal phosphate-dependent enzyme, partial [Rhodospirillales bacterium]|nr:aminotransferase class I/II-fold pyridoxal phosphate-dependent enzyme [Rhodospirillales bacterium]